MDVPLSAVPPWLQWVIVIAAVLAVVAGGIRAVPPLWQFITRIINLVDALTELPDFLERNDPILQELNRQIVNDHGHVILRNQLDTVEAGIKDAKRRLERVEDGVKGLYDDQENLTQRFNDAENTWRSRRPDGN